MPLRSPIKKQSERKKLSPVSEALWVVVPYFVLGCLWIFFSDALLNMAPDAQGMVLISNIKGWAYVLITAAMLWALIYSRIRRLKAGESALADSEARFKLLVESAPDAVFVQTDYRFAYVNAKTLELFGATKEEDLLGQYLPDRYYGEYRGMVTEAINRLYTEHVGVPRREEIILRLDGQPVDVEVIAAPIRYNNHESALVFMRDISGRKKDERSRRQLELQVRQKHRLEAIGTLASGIAHEINNPITGIINYAQLIADSPFADEQLRDYSQEIMHEGLRVAETVKNLLSFSKLEKQTFQPASVCSIVKETIALTEAVLRHDQISLTVNVAEGLPDIRCSAQQLRQVLMNLITNARDALNARYPGYDDNKKLTVTADPAERKGQPWVRFTVEDHGDGIREELLPKVFDPFFTTSTRSEHTGLGLSISLGIVKEHRGDVWFETQPGEYTRAIVELPSDGGVLV